MLTGRRCAGGTARRAGPIARITPAELGRSSVGHFGGFRTGVGEPLWQEMLTAVTGDAPVRVVVSEGAAGVAGL